tara:strand:+ start:512 stop:2494 length:1983 start_codon:yes stop_codon:yes gene_type:complete
MTPDFEVKQSADSGTVFDFHTGELAVSLTFLSSTKGRMEFAVTIAEEAHGKVNVLSQHSIARLAKNVEPEDVKLFTKDFLAAGVVLREGTYTPAPVQDRIEAEVESFSGEESSYGTIDEKTINKFLGEPHLLSKINHILHESRATPFVGDDANLLLTFLVFLSCKTDNPLNLEMIGQSSSGKTYMTLTARNGFPKSMVMVLAGASKEALKYDYDEIDEDGNFIVNVDGRCIVVLEKDESYAFIRKMKPIMSGDDDELVWKTPIKNEISGEIETKDFIIRGRPSFITLTTRNPNEAEQITRQLIMTPDTTVEKVDSVVKNALMAKARPEHFMVHADLKLLQASMLGLTQYKVRNIFAPLMADFFPARNAQHQRDIGKVLSIIDAVALLHQKQRPIQKTSDGEEYLLASVEDNVLGLILCDLVLRASLSGVPDGSWNVFQQMNAMAEAKRPLTEDNILQWLGLHAFQTTKNALKEKHLPTLEDAGLIEVSRRGGGRGGGRKTYKLVAGRVGLMDDYALAPLFVESCRKNLKEVIGEYSDVLTSSSPAETKFQLKANDKNNLMSLGCTKADHGVWRSLFLPVYLRPKGKETFLKEVIGDSKHTSNLFSGNAWFTGEFTATDSLSLKREKIETVRQASKVISSEDDDAWEQLMEAQLEQIEEND